MFLSWNESFRTMMKYIVTLVLLFFSVEVFSQRIDSKQIWYNNNHSAFTSLVKYKGNYYCAFREAGAHISKGADLGKIRIISSKNGKKWSSVALLSKEYVDLRDPWLSITPKGLLMVSMGGSSAKLNFRAQVSFSKDGKFFSVPQPVQFDYDGANVHGWPWHLTWHKGMGYTVMYRSGVIVLLKTKDGIHYDFITQLQAPGFLDESVIQFLSDDRMVILTRREFEHKSSLLWISNPPYDNWTYNDTGVYIGGPELMELDDEHLLIGGRRVDEKGQYTCIWTSDLNGNFKEILSLHNPVFDCSYPSFLKRGRKIWCTYYASYGKHEDAAIYLTKIPVKLIKSSYK